MNSRGAYRGDGSAEDAAILKSEVEAVKAARNQDAGDAIASLLAAYDAARPVMTPPRNATTAAASEALEQEVAELLYVTRDYTWQIQARRVIELLKGESCTK